MDFLLLLPLSISIQQTKSANIPKILQPAVATAAPALLPFAYVLFICKQFVTDSVYNSALIIYKYTNKCKQNMSQNVFIIFPHTVQRLSQVWQIWISLSACYR